MSTSTPGRLAIYLILLFGAIPACIAMADDPAPKPPSFIIGVWSQPAGSFVVWKVRGINTVVCYESESNKTSMGDWSSAAVEADLFMIRKPSADIQSDLKEPRLLAWMQADEPDVKKPPVDPDQLADLYAACKRADPKRPVFLNLSGGNVLFNKVPQETYVAYLKNADWVGNDFYPVTGWNHPDWLPKVGQVVDKLRGMSGGKAQFAFIETSNQRLPWMPPDTRGVTADQFRAEIWDAVIYFPQQIGYGFKYDNTTGEVAAEMSAQNQTLSELGDVLATRADPVGIGIKAPDPIEAGCRKAADGTLYFLALNLSGDSKRDQIISFSGTTATSTTVVNENNRTLRIDKSELIDDFSPYQLHIYRITPK